MRRMTGFDALFLYDETPNEPQHTLKVAILGPSFAARSDWFACAKDVATRKLAQTPPFSWRAMRVPFGLHHPVWVEDGRIDADHHIRRLAIPSPGGRRELSETISELAAIPLDPTKPLWELWFLEGYEGGRVAAVLKISHALVDGSATKELLESLLGEAPTAPIRTLPSATRTETAPPSKRKLLAHAFRELGRDLFVEIPRLARATLAARRRLRSEGNVATPPNPFRAPRNAFGGPLSRRRAFTFTTVSLDEAKRIKSAHDVTLNDVLIATVAGAARRYLDGRRDLPAEPILGSLTASIRDENERGVFGNRVTARFYKLPTHLADPVERLHRAHEEAAVAKQDVARRAGAHLELWLAAMPPIVLKLFGRLIRRVVRFTRVSGGVVVSSVPGPRKPLYAGSTLVENFISVGHMKYVAGLNVTVWSYADKLNFAIYACREAVPDAWRIADAIDESFAELSRAAAPDAARAA